MSNNHGIRIHLAPEEQHLGTGWSSPGRKLVQCECVFKTNFAADGSPLKYEAILIYKGYSQVHGI